MLTPFGGFSSVFDLEILEDSALTFSCCCWISSSSEESKRLVVLVENVRLEFEVFFLLTTFVGAGGLPLVISVSAAEELLCCLSLFSSPDEEESLMAFFLAFLAFGFFVKSPGALPPST